MSLTSQKIICETHFRDFGTNKTLKIGGRADIDCLISTKKKYINFENYIFQNQQWKKNLCKIPKVDVIKINVYKAQLILKYDKGVLIVDENRKENTPGQSKNKYKSINALI